jgi:hypothetical protein
MRSIGSPVATAKSAVAATKAAVADRGATTARFAPGG